VNRKKNNAARQIKPVAPVRQGQSANGVTSAAPATVSNNRNGLHLLLSPRQVTAPFAVVVAALIALHVIVNTLRFTLGNEKLFGLVFMFSLGADGNIPTFYSSFALLFAGCLLLFIGYLVRKLQRTRWIYWLGLGGVFCFLAVDEMLELHERLIEPVRNVTGVSGLLYYAWVIPYAFALLALGLLYLRFLLSLPRRTAVMFVISGTVFVTGAVGFEMLGGLFFQTFGSNTPGYVVLQTVEESMEMIGVVMFIYALVDYMARELGGMQITIEHATTGNS